MLMRFLYTILLGILFVYVSAFAVMAQTTSPVLLEAPKPLGDIRTLKREKDIETFKPVAERTPTAFKPVPVRWRSFVIYPSLVSQQSVDTNIFATSENEEVDTITSLNPSLLVTKNFGRHQASASINGELKKYWSNTDEDVFNFDTSVRGTLEAKRELTIPFELTYTSGHEGRGQNFSPNFSEKPIGFEAFGSALGINYNPNRLNLSFLGRYSNISFDNGKSRSGSTIVREDGDRSLAGVEIGASYEILPNHQPFISVDFGRISYKRRDFDGTSFSGVKRDSSNIDALAGWQFAYKGLVESSVGAGFSVRNYDDSSIEDIRSSRLAANIGWNLTKKATLSLGLKRAITEDSQILQGAVLTQGRTSFDYEFLHNLYYNAYLDYALADFGGGNREDKIMSIGTGVRYLINPRFSISGDYRFKARDSSAVGIDYDRHQFMMRLHTRF